MLALRKRSRGLMAQDDADTMAVSRVEDGATASAAGKGTAGGAAMERDDDLRYLYGPATPAETLDNEAAAIEAKRRAASNGTAIEDLDDEDEVVQDLR